jgi:putative hydrolase of the HAD superfamily
MTTVLVHSACNDDHPVHREIRGWLEPPEHVHHMTDDLTRFLLQLPAAPQSPARAAAAANGGSHA